jgi:hypothetical protein
LGAIAVVLKQERKGMTLLIWFILSIVAVYTIGIQPQRLVLNIGLTIIFLSGYFVEFIISSNKVKTFINETNPGIEVIPIFITLVLFLAAYLPIYSEYTVVDNSYLSSDEYITASWLNDNLNSSYRVYMMYGSKFRGVQWLNTFYPDIKQVLGGFDQGARAADNRLPFEFDNLIKWGTDPSETHLMAIENNVRYVVVDRIWLTSESSGAYEKFEDSTRFRSIDTVNSELVHAEIFEVMSVEPLIPADSAYGYWDESRFLGIIVTSTLLIFFCILFKWWE